MTTRILFTALALAALAACETPLALDPLRSESQELDAGISLTLDASRTEIAPGDTVRLVATVTNRNSHAVRIEFSSGCQVLFYAEDRAGTVVYPDGGGWICTGALTELRLEAGESREYVHGWTGQVSEYVSGSGRVTYRALPAGPYELYAVLNGSLPDQRVQLRTAKKVVTVR